MGGGRMYVVSDLFIIMKRHLKHHEDLSPEGMKLYRKLKKYYGGNSRGKIKRRR